MIVYECLLLLILLFVKNECNVVILLNVDVCSLSWFYFRLKEREVMVRFGCDGKMNKEDRYLLGDVLWV